MSRRPPRPSLSSRSSSNKLAAELKPIIEELPSRDYGQAVRDMKGFVVNRDKVILVEPDARYSSTLARKVGTDEDRAYFDFMLKVAPEGYWPIYVVRQTDVGGCAAPAAAVRARLASIERAEHIMRTECVAAGDPQGLFDGGSLRRRRSLQVLLLRAAGKPGL